MIRKIALLLGTALLTVSLAQASVWVDDPPHSSITFAVRHMMISNVHGRFDKFNVTVNYDEQDVTKSTVQVTIDAASINTGIDQRDNHLRSPDFLDAATYRQLIFVSKRIEKTDGGLKITGDLTMRDVTKEVVVNVTDLTPPLKDMMGRMRMGASGSAQIDRTAWGLVWNKVLETGGVLVGNDVNISIELELVAK